MKKSIISAVLVGSVAAAQIPDAEAGRYDGAGKVLKELFELGAEGAARAAGRNCSRNAEECEASLKDALDGAFSENKSGSSQQNNNKQAPAAPADKLEDSNDDLDQYLEEYYETHPPTNE